MRVAGSEYLEWFKARRPMRFNLAMSGAPAYPIAELGVSIEEIERNASAANSRQSLQQALAAKAGVSPDSVVTASGTSLANYLAMAALVEPGDDVLVEHPAYEPLLAVARYAGGDVKRFTRSAESGFEVRVEEVERSITNRTKLIVIANLHNPTSVRTHEDTLRAIGTVAKKVGARVLVDEVYLECLYEQFRTVFRLGSEFVVTSSLTKAYGLSGLRCGWVLAEPELARRMRRIKDLLDPAEPHPAEPLSVAALQQLDRIGARAKSLLEGNRAVLNQFLDSRKELIAVRPQFGTSVFPRLKDTDTDGFVTLLRDRYETDVVPGKFFGAPDHFRLGMGCDPETFAQGLERLGAALDEIQR